MEGNDEEIGYSVVARVLRDVNTNDESNTGRKRDSRFHVTRSEWDVRWAKTIQGKGARDIPAGPRLRRL